MWRSLAILSMAGLMLGACAGTATTLPELDADAMASEARTQETRALTTRRENMERLMRIARPILVANAPLCPKTRPTIGVQLHSADSYDKRLRPAALRELGAGEHLSVFVVAPDSPASRAGLRPGDRFLRDGKPMGGAALRDALGESGGTLSVQRGLETLSVELVPETTCASGLRLQDGSAINAYANGRTITVSAGMLEFVDSDEELALIVGHELAHNTMGHIRKSVMNYLLSGGATRYTRPFESESDYVGMYYMVRAGFDPAGVEDVWRRLAEVDPRSVNRAKTHPTFPDRYLRLAATRAEIEAKQAAGEPLIPNFKKTADAAQD